MTRYRLTVEYDGTGFNGWQRQPDARTVEGVIEEACEQVLQQPVDLIGQGRTDAGVHARGQVAHLDLNEDVDIADLLYRVNGMIGHEVQITGFEQTDSGFHARFDAAAREYEYTLNKNHYPLEHRYSWALPRDADLNKIRECAGLFLGEHDFEGFSKLNEGQQHGCCTVFISEFEETDRVLRYRVKANRFLRNMVRRIVGSMVKVGEGKLSTEDLKMLLHDPEAGIASHAAPAKGLQLMHVFYEKS